MESVGKTVLRSVAPTGTSGTTRREIGTARSGMDRVFKVISVH
jgi:hypothetical protein